jgi:hypothetical protein
MFHTLEAYALSPYLMRGEDESFSVTDVDGRTKAMCFRRHERGPDRRFAATQALLESAAILRKGRVAASASLLVECAPMAKLVLERMREDPGFLVEQAAAPGSADTARRGADN